MFCAAFFFPFQRFIFNPPATVPIVESTLEWFGDDVTEREGAGGEAEEERR